MNDKYQPGDWRSLELHQLVAARLQKDPSLVDKAVGNIERWKSQNGFPQTYLDDWLAIINMGLGHLLAFMLSETDEAQRLRSSSPFVGEAFITQEEREMIFEKFKSN